MKIYIRGTNDKIEKKEMKDIISFFGYQLLGPRLYKNIMVTLKYRPDFPSTLYVLCGPTDWDAIREFEILLNPNINKKQQIKVVAHEMVHLKQFARGHLKEYARGGYRWMGNFIGDLKYDSLPWEKEANKLQEELYSHYLEYHKEE